jgi:hypothetical protein
MCEMFQMGAHILCWYGGRVCLWALSGIDTVLFLVCILCIRIFSVFCNYSLYFLCKLFTSPNQAHSPPHITNTCAPNMGRWSFYGNEFYTPFSFHNVWCLCSNSLFINQIKLLLFWKVLQHFPKFNSSLKKPPHIRWLSPKKLYMGYSSVEWCSQKTRAELRTMQTIQRWYRLYSELLGALKKYISDYYMEHVKPKLVYICEASQLNNRTHVPLQECNYTKELARLGSHEYMNQQLRLEW